MPDALARDRDVAFAHPEREWTLSSLAASVAMSRPAFAARFTEPGRRARHALRRALVNRSATPNSGLTATGRRDVICESPRATTLVTDLAIALHDQVQGRASCARHRSVKSRCSSFSRR